MAEILRQLLILDCQTARTERKLGNEIQTAGAVQGNTLAGAATTIVGGIVQTAAPAGTIDVNAQIRITGSGSNIRVSGTAQSRPYPSVTGYAYLLMPTAT